MVVGCITAAFYKREVDSNLENLTPIGFLIKIPMRPMNRRTHELRQLYYENEAFNKGGFLRPIIVRAYLFIYLVS